MITIQSFIFIVVCHWIFDFIFQDERWALGKSKSIKALLKHTITYSLLWIIPTTIFTGNFYGALIFSMITFVAHTVTDYFTSKIVSKKFANKQLGGPIPNVGAFSWIGFDQVLHYAQLGLTWLKLF